MKKSGNSHNGAVTRYNKTRQADPHILGKLFQFLSPEKNKLYLDIGCGTGNYTIGLSERGINFWGGDPSIPMIQVAKKKSKKINWLPGSSENIPADESAFDGAIATLTIHHWSSLKQSFAELGRVMKENSKIVIFSTVPAQMNGYWLNNYFPNMMRLSIAQMSSLETLNAVCTESGFSQPLTEKYFVRNDLIDLFLYSGKHQPEIYFDNQVREGISSFSSFAGKMEIEEGLAQLRIDIGNGKFEKVKNEYNNNCGDYLFISAEKNKSK